MADLWSSLTLISVLPHQARDVEPMLFKSWANVEDVGSTLKQQWLNVSCLLGQVRHGKLC